MATRKPAAKAAIQTKEFVCQTVRDVDVVNGTAETQEVEMVSRVGGGKLRMTLDGSGLNKVEAGEMYNVSISEA